MRLLAFWIIALQVTTSAQTAGKPSLPTQWPAQWIAAPSGPARDYDVLYFRKDAMLKDVPKQLLIDVSADTRFDLHINGARVGAGPALGDLQHWRFERFDIAPYLHPGKNTVAAIVWNFGTLAPLAQMSSQTAFLLSTEDPAYAALDTDNSWLTLREAGRTVEQPRLRGYYAAGPAEILDGRKMHWDWDSVSSSGDWTPAKPLGHAAPRGTSDPSTRWVMEADDLPAMAYSPISVGKIVRVDSTQQNKPLGEELPLTVPARTHITVLLDHAVLTTAYPWVQIDKGKDATITITYAESLYDEKGEKGNRNEITNRQIDGLHDRITSDGAPRTFQTLWWRTWRYLQLDIDTKDQPLILNGLGAFYTAYPFITQAHFESDNPELSRIWETGWRTAQLCAHETYMDTPYWEQLQYIGDTRIQALISYGVSGDDRLARQALKAYRDSLLTEGLTQSRFPSSLSQVIPPFSLLWIGMLHDFWEYRGDGEFVASILPSTRGVLDWFSARQRKDGLLGTIEWWPFVDYGDPFGNGVPPQEADGGSSTLTLQYIEALRYAAELENRFGEIERAQEYKRRADLAADGLLRLNWDQRTGLLADTPAKKTFGPQANSLAVWLDIIPKQNQKEVMEKVLASSLPAYGNPSNLPATQMPSASLYFRFYITRAMVHAGLGEAYLAALSPWRDMLHAGLSTWAEMPNHTRSDSHAWSAHPTLDLLTVVAGIQPASPGFSRVQIQPHLGNLQHVNAAMPTPQGMIEVHYTRTASRWDAEVSLPPNVLGSFLWEGNSIPLKSGNQHLNLE